MFFAIYFHSTCLNPKRKLKSFSFTFSFSSWHIILFKYIAYCLNDGDIPSFLILNLNFTLKKYLHISNEFLLSIINNEKYINLIRLWHKGNVSVRFANRINRIKKKKKKRKEEESKWRKGWNRISGFIRISQREHCCARKRKRTFSTFVRAVVFCLRFFLKRVSS